MTNTAYLHQLRTPSATDPLRVLVSACLTGACCGFDGTPYGSYPSVGSLLHHPAVRLVSFCPEEYAFGTPREICDIHGGSGMDVLDGKAKVLTQTGKDWTSGMLRASEKMLQLAVREAVDLAIMMDISAACGSQVIYAGSRLAENKKYQAGAGVCAAQLIRNGFYVISQRDYASLEILHAKIDPGYVVNPEARDHQDTEWYRDYFSRSG